MSFQDLEAGRGIGSRRSLANGRQDPTQAVASGIFQINTAVSTFRRLVNTLGRPKDTPELREKLHKTRLHIGQLVKDTSAKLKQASEEDHQSEVSLSISNTFRGTKMAILIPAGKLENHRCQTCKRFSSRAKRISEGPAACS